jgi:hypothetical protein
MRPQCCSCDPVMMLTISSAREAAPAQLVLPLHTVSLNTAVTGYRMGPHRSAAPLAALAPQHAGNSRFTAAPAYAM